MPKAVTRFRLLLALLALGTGCANLDAIRDFAAISSAASDYTALVDEYIADPERGLRYVHPHFEGRNPFNESDRAALRKEAERRKNQRESLLALHKTVSDYMSALGRLAADELTSYDKQLDALVKSAQDAKLVSDKTGQAMGTIAKLLFKAAGEQYRQRKLNELIGCAEVPLQGVLAAQDTFAYRAFAGSLAAESERLRQFYDVHAALSSDPAGKAALAEFAHTAEIRNAQRRKAIDAYRKVLAKIKEGHTELFRNRGKLDRKELLERLRQHARDLKTLFETVREIT